MEAIGKYVTALAQQLGTENPSSVLLLSLVGFLFLSLILFALRTSIQRNREGDRTAAILMRIDKVEKNFQDLQQDVLKAVHKFRQLTDEVKSELEGVKKVRGPGGSGDGGSGSLGGSGYTGPGSGSTPGFSSPEFISTDSSAPKVEASSNIKRGLEKTRTTFLGRLKNLFQGKSQLTEDGLDDLEEVLVTADVGIGLTQSILTEVRAKSGSAGVTIDQLRTTVKEILFASLPQPELGNQLYVPTKSPTIILVVGVNGVGKTTTVAKLGAKYQRQGKKVLFVAADTFRAAAVEQLKSWATKLNIPVISGAPEAKPASVVFDGMLAAKKENVDVVLIDTAGRLHTKSNLMQELEGVRNSITKHFPDGPHETILVVDGVSGQNALSQAREFNSAVKLSGVIVTKLDGTSKGGIVFAISKEVSVPVLYIGVGEQVDDLIPFQREEFVESVLHDSSNVGDVHSSSMLSSITIMSPTDGIIPSVLN